MRLAAALLATAVLASCSAAPRQPDQATQEASAAARLQAIPLANPEKYRGTIVSKDWRNPYLIIRPDGVGLRDLPNNEIHILKVGEVAEVLARLPASAWPYGRVVAIEEDGRSGSTEDTIRMRANKGIVSGTLQSMHVRIEWVPSA